MNRRIKKKVAKRQLIKAMQGLVDLAQEWECREEERFPYSFFLLTVPIHLKITLTIREAAEYSNIGINKIDSMLKQPNCPFVLYVGTRKLVKRKEFEEYIRRELII